MRDKTMSADKRLMDYAQRKGGNKKKQETVMVELTMRETNALLEVLYWGGNEVGPDRADGRKLYDKVQKSRERYIKNRG